MGERTKRLVIAVSLAVLDGVVAGYYGGVVWRAFSGIIWTKLLVLMLAALWATSLLNVWTRAYYDLRHAIQDRGVTVLSRMQVPPAALTEDSNV